MTALAALDSLLSLSGLMHLPDSHVRVAAKPAMWNWQSKILQQWHKQQHSPLTFARFF